MLQVEDFFLLTFSSNHLGDEDLQSWLTELKLHHLYNNFEENPSILELFVKTYFDPNFTVTAYSPTPILFGEPRQPLKQLGKIFGQPRKAVTKGWNHYLRPRNHFCFVKNSQRQLLSNSHARWMTKKGEAHGWLFSFLEGTSRARKVGSKETQGWNWRMYAARE